MLAPITKAHSLNLKVGTPMISAASSSSRIATQDRPTRDRSRLPTNSSTTMMRKIVTQYHQTLELSVFPTLPAENIPSGKSSVTPTRG